ncbi:MAG TPA: hypothetical protein VGM81_14495 [Burkholderiaceae bacterium]|jgi:hypothetical protein
MNPVRNLWAVIGATLAIASASGGALATELRPSFSLPSQRDAQVAEVRAVPLQMQMQQQQLQQQQSPPEAFYKKFETDARSFPPATMARLRTQFIQRAEAANRKGAADEARHYQRMLGILDAAKK